MKAVHFGAGNIGRGFIGNLLNESGYEVCFVDVNSDMINEINKDKSYLVQLLGDEKGLKKILPVSALNSRTQENEVIEEIVTADLITTSVGVNNLVNIAPVIAKGLVKRINKMISGVDVIANENAINASSTLKEEVLKLLTKEEADLVSKYIGFPNSAIDRQALSIKIDGAEVAVVEPYFEWGINQSEIVNEKTLLIKGATYVEDMNPFIERKLYCVNAGHVTAAYTGFLLGKETVQDALADEKIKTFVKNTMNETAQYLIKEYNMTPEEMESYINKTIQRHGNTSISDSVFRVGGSPIRKLGYNERLVAPARKLYGMGMPVKYITKVIAAAFNFYNSDDKESKEIQEHIKLHAIESAVKHFTKLTDNELIEMILENYELIKSSDNKWLRD